MLRRKNNDIIFNQNLGNHSPYRFERKNPNLSPGLSPMRCRTPTRGNVSPFRVTAYNENHRGQSPIKFVSNKPANPSTNGFFRQDFPSNIMGNHNQKYTTYGTNNDHSMRRQSYYENDNSSRQRSHHQNSQRMMVHENTKLFSKLVSKLNSQKKKEPQLVRRNTKPQISRPTEISQYQNKSICLSKQKTPNQTEKMVDQIQPVQSVVYQQKNKKTFSQKKIHLTVQNGKQNKTVYQQQAYKIKEQIKITSTKENQAKKPQKSTNQVKIDFKTQPFKIKENQIIRNQQGSNKKSQKSCKKENKLVQENLPSLSKPIFQQNNLVSQKKLNAQFDDVKMYLDKLKDSFGFMGINKDESIGNISDTYKNVNVSLMNMDPFI